MFECKCDDPRGLRVTVSRGRVLRICDDCRGWRYERYVSREEVYSRPITNAPAPAMRQRKRLSLTALR